MSGTLSKSLKEILSDPEALSPPEPVIPFIAWRGRVTMLAAREKDGKSTLAAAGASAVSAGDEFLSEATTLGPVLWVGLEEHPADLAGRFVAFNANAETLHVLSIVPDAIDTLESEVKQIRPRLIVVDTLAAFTAGLIEDAGSASKWTPIMQGFTRVAREYDAAILLLHHANKAKGSYRDSTAIGAGVDVILEMRTVKEDPTAREIKGRGRWKIGNTRIVYTNERYLLVAGDVSRRTQILRFVQQNPGCSQNKIKDGVTGRTELIASELKSLIDANEVENRGSAARPAYYVCATVSRENPRHAHRETLSTPQTPLVSRFPAMPETLLFPQVQRETPLTTTVSREYIHIGES